MKSISIRLEDNLSEAMRQISIEERRTLNTIYTIAVEEYLKNRGVKIGIAAPVVPQNSKNEGTVAAAQKDSPKQAKTANKPSEQNKGSNSAASTENIPQWKQNIVAKQQVKAAAKQADKPQDTPIIDTSELSAVNEPSALDDFNSF